MKISNLKIQAFFLAFPVFVFSMIIFPYYVSGDQQFYRAFYHEVSGLSFFSAFKLYRETLGSSEPGYFSLVYMVADYFIKDFLMSIINLFFAYYLFLWMLKVKVKKIIFPLMYMNFYFLVLLFSAERLKVAILIGLIGMSTNSSFKLVFYGLSILTHVQVIMLVASGQVRGLLSTVEQFMRGKVGFGLISLSILLALGLLILFILKDHILSKFEFYSETGGGISEVIKPLIFAFFAMYYARCRWIEALVASMPMVVVSYLLGGDRVVIFSYFIFMYYSLQKNGGLNFATIIVGLYFNYKGWLFLGNVFAYGDGFPPVQ